MSMVTSSVPHLHHFAGRSEPRFAPRFVRENQAAIRRALCTYDPGQRMVIDANVEKQELDFESYASVPIG